MDVTLDDIRAARDRIADRIEKTPCIRSRLSGLCDAEVFCKLEYRHPTGSFKERGARNALAQLPPPSQAPDLARARDGNRET